MTTRVAVVPSAPALLPDLAGRVDVLAELRARAESAVAAVVAGLEEGEPGGLALVVVADPPPAPRATPGTRSNRLAPLGRRVGEHLLGSAGIQVCDSRVEIVTVPADAPTDSCARLGMDLAERAAALVVVADGSACRTQKAPGYLDERAFGVDDAIVAGVCRPDAAALLALDPDLCAEVMAAGRASLQVLGGFLTQQPAYRTQVCHVEDPLGVLYLVAEMGR
ncbi:MAG: hypothetical protein ACK5MP_04970 [Nostocoides sp.]